MPISAPAPLAQRGFRFRAMCAALILGLLSACSTTVVVPEVGIPPAVPGSNAVGLPSSSAQWIAQDWSVLPGWQTDNLDEAWQAWLASCQRPRAAWRALCPGVVQLKTSSQETKRAWMQARLQPYRLQNPSGTTVGKLTSYYEPEFEASRIANTEFAYPIYSPPASMRKPWLQRSAIESPTPPIELRGRDWAYLRSPVDVLNLHIQGSGRLSLRQPNGNMTPVRAAFADSNGHPFRSPFQWLIRTGQLRNPNWQSVQAWTQRNAPERVQEMLNYNPRYIFFRQEVIASDGLSTGPKGAEGVPLTAGRSIAVDPRSVPYGTPVWISSSGSTTSLNRLVLAQDTGSAILGAIRADYFAGTGAQAGLFAQGINQPLEMWVLWPK